MKKVYLVGFLFASVLACEPNQNEKPIVDGFKSYLHNGTMGESVVVSDRDYLHHFRVGAPTSVRGKVFFTHTQHERGREMHVAYLSESDYATYVKRYGRNSYCPDSFLKPRLKEVDLVPKNMKLRDQIRSQSFKKGDLIMISGNELIPVKTTIEGDKVRANFFHYRRVYVQSLTNRAG